MDSSLQRKELIAEYRSYLAIINQKGLVFDVASEDEIDSMELSDLSLLVRKARDLARTPT